MKILIAMLTVTALACSSCTTTKDANGNTTTGIDQSAATQAAIAAAIQIATAAAQTAIQTYLTAVPTHARLAVSNPAILAAERATADQVSRAQPSLSAAQVKKIVANAYSKALHGQ